MTVMKLASMVAEIHNPVWLNQGLQVRVTIKDVRKIWARVDFLIAPLEGSGECWVSSEKVTGSHLKNSWPS